MGSQEEERLRILNLVARGAMTPVEAASLLAAVQDPVQAPIAPPEQASQGAGEVDTGRRPVSIRLQIGSVATGRESVNITLPIALAEATLRFVPRHTLEEAGVNVPNLISALRSGQTGLIFEGRHDRDRQYIRVTVE